MRIAIFSDMHGNLTAMKAAYDDAKKVGFDEVICLGDVTAVGPQPNATLAFVRDLKCPVLMGNHDEWLITQNDGLLVPKSDTVDGVLFRIIRDIDAWCRSQLTEEELDYISGFQHVLKRTIHGHDLLFYHASPRSNDDMLVATTPSETVDEMLDGHTEPIMVGGHSHLQMIRRHFDKLLINVGSIGAPFYFNTEGAIRNPWWAEYGIITVEEEFISYDLRRVFYNINETLGNIDASGMPHKDWYIKARDKLSQ